MEEQIVRLESGLMNCEYKIDELRSLDEAEFAGKVKELIFEARDSFPF